MSTPEVSHSVDSSGSSPQHALNAPLWPQSGLDLTTPRHFLFMAISFILGLICYSQGYTFDGGTLVFLALVVIFSRTYYTRAYKGLAYFLVLMCIIPPANVLQNKFIAAGQITWRPDALYLLGRVTAEGDGPFKWTRFLFTGQEQPSLDGSVDHLLLSYMYCVSFIMLMHALPARFKRPSRASQVGFYALFVAVTAAFLSLPFVSPSPTGQLDWMWAMTSMSFGFTWLGILLSKSYRKLTRTPAMLLWMVFMGVIVAPIFDTLHTCINNDYWLPVANNMKPLLMCGEIPLPGLMPYYCLGFAALYPALLGLFQDFLGKWVVRDERYTYPGELKAAEDAS
ncbi:hypothetical protein [Archangium primigenium]|uniref:hypothetical protein n=1 Tax=[Archangium] primigenium TaxID=2792470 RepID=UPI0019569643|nr:hypothetical protein [Archangium primigenium]